MAGLATSGSNPDVSLLYDINGLAKTAPGWLNHTMEFLGEWGLLLGLVLLVPMCWWSQRRHSPSLDAAASSAAAVLWTPLAACAAVLINVPIRGFVDRPRPFVDHDGIDVLLQGKHDYSFVSDHATLAMALATGLFVVSRKFGLIGLVLALAEGFSRVFLGVHYPTDVIGGFALGTAVVLLLSPLATAALTPLMKAVGSSVRAGGLILARTDAARVGSGGEGGVLTDETAGSLGATAAPNADAETDADDPVPVGWSAAAGRPDAVNAAEREPEVAFRTGTERKRHSGTDPAGHPEPSTREQAPAMEARTARDPHEPGPRDPAHKPGPRDPKGPREPDLAA